MPADHERQTDSGVSIAPFYTAADGADRADPGAYPYARGIRPDGYRERLL